MLQATASLIDEFELLLAEDGEKKAETRYNESDLIANDTAVQTNSRYDLLGLLRDPAGTSSGLNGDIKRTRNNTPPSDMLELIREQDQDEDLLNFQNKLYNWTFRQGNVIGVRYDEGSYDIDDYSNNELVRGEPGIQSEMDHRKWPSNAVHSNGMCLPESIPKGGENFDPERKRAEPACSYYTYDPLVRYFASLLKCGFVESFRQIIRIVSTNQQQYLALHAQNHVTEKDILIKKEPGLLVQLGEMLGQTESFSQNGLHDSAFSTCYNLISQYGDYDHNVDTILDTLKNYLYKLSRRCREDGGKCQATAACMLADHLKQKGNDLESFGLFTEIYYLSQNKSWTLDEGLPLADHAASNLFDLYIRWGQAQDFPMLAEEYYLKAEKMADHVRNNQLRLIASCCLVESSFLLDRLDVEGCRMILLDLNNNLGAENHPTFIVRDFLDWAEAILLCRGKQYSKAVVLIKRYISSQEQRDNPHQLHKAYRELALIYEMQGHTHVAFHLFQSAWQSKRRAPVLPDVDGFEEIASLRNSDATKPDNKNLDFISYIRSVYHNVKDPVRRKHAIEICQLYLEMARPTQREIDSEGYGHVNMDTKLACLDHEIRMPVPCDLSKHIA